MEHLRGCLSLAPVRARARGPGRTDPPLPQDPESGASYTQASRPGEEPRYPLNTQTQLLELPPPGRTCSRPPPPCYSRWCLDTKPPSTLAMPHLLHLLCGITPRILKTHSRVRIHTQTHRHAYPPFLSCFHCFSVSFQRGVWSPRGSVQLRRRSRPCQSPSVFPEEGEFPLPTPLLALPQAWRYRDLELRCPKPRLCILRPPGILALVV